MVEHDLVDCIVTTAGGVEEDLIKCLAHSYLGSFNLDGATLRTNGLNRYCALLLDKIGVIDCSTILFIVAKIRKFFNNVLKAVLLMLALANLSSILQHCFKFIFALDF